MYIIALQI